jgi:hypothetical protein
MIQLVLHSILIDFGMPMELVRPIKMCLNEMYSKVRIGTYFSENFPISNYLNQGDALSPLFFNFVLECVTRNAQDKRD